jgi:hypothetical protein
MLNVSPRWKPWVWSSRNRAPEARHQIGSGVKAYIRNQKGASQETTFEEEFVTTILKKASVDTMRNMYSVKRFGAAPPPPQRPQQRQRRGPWLQHCPSATDQHGRKTGCRFVTAPFC